ncbi:MAG: response regulator transcription factor [Cytophagaceae bacterium]|nr:response regulator transcription factor [Cytophagaceae bacterium]MBL0302129.1 response regulator transcription factor [Cytophagaceae bacterium]MBL0324948.1 response regulator transcription factor [Cytophagaceae bacterium]
MNLLIADDHTLFIEGLTMLVSRIEDVHIVGDAKNGKEVIELCQNQKVDLILMDLEMPQMGGIEATEIIKRDFPNIKIIAVTMLNDYNTIKKALRSGMDGYVVKNLGIAELQNAIETVMNGQIYMSPEITTILALGVAGRKPNQAYVPDLTKREKEVIKLIIDGLTNDLIAEKLFLSPLTVSTHRKNVLSKLNLKNTAMLVKYCGDYPEILL